MEAARPLAAIALGQGNKKRAEKILGNSTSLLLFFSVILMELFLIFKCPLLISFWGRVLIRFLFHLHILPYI